MSCSKIVKKNKTRATLLWKQPKTASEAGKKRAALLFVPFYDKIVPKQGKTSRKRRTTGRETVMFENAKRIRAKECADTEPQYYFCDLNVIYPLRKATLHIAAGGVYEAFVGKERVGKDILVPGPTEVEKPFMYQTYDITSLVAESDFLTVRVSGDRNHGLIAQIDLEFAGGLSKTIVTDESWLCGKSAVSSSVIYNGAVFYGRGAPNTDKPEVVLDSETKELTGETHER